MQTEDLLTTVAENPEMLGVVFLKMLLLNDRTLGACNSTVNCGP